MNHENGENSFRIVCKLKTFIHECKIAKDACVCIYIIIFIYIYIYIQGKASERTCENSDEHRSTKVEGSKEPTTFPDEEKRKERQEEEKKGKEETLN